MYKLFLDDERFPAVDSIWSEFTIFDHVVLVSQFDTKARWYICRTVPAAIALIGIKGCPEHIAFDHDLQTEETGFTFAKWLVETDMDKDGKFFLKEFSFYVHSQNVNGAANIQKYLDQYLSLYKV